MNTTSPPISFWHDSLEPGDDLRPRAALGGDVDVDVAIIGAGFGGLWTAYYLLRADPSLRVIVFEKETAGFGASGRNGGWCVGDQGASLAVLDDEGGAGTGAAMMREMFASVDEVGAVVEREGIDCGFTKGGALWLASDARQLRRLRARVASYRRHGLEDDYELLSPAETVQRVNATGIHGSIYSPHAAAVHPARLARGIARAVERLGGTIHEHTAVTRAEGRRVRTEHGTVRADVVVRATEAYSNSLEGHERTMLPIGNYMIATEPISEDLWAEIGLSERELFEDSPVMLAYGQRTADNRIAWGGLGAPYWWRSRVPPSPMQAPRTAARLRDRLVARFPMLEGVEITHHWGGVLGMTRDLRPTVGYDPATGEAWAGGYGGAGVAAANSAGRTLSDLITGNDSHLTGLPWVNHRCRQWEPEPLRWLGVHAMTTSARVSDLLGRL